MAELASDNYATVLIPPDVPEGAPQIGGREVVHSGEVFGTTWSLRLVRKSSTNPANDTAYRAQLVKACSQALALIDAQMSLWQDDSDISHFNRLTPGAALSLPEPLATVTGKAFNVCEETKGAFYPGLYEAVEQWGFGSVDKANPVATGLAFSREWMAPAAMAGLLSGNVIERHRGFALDLNGIAKGYAVDLLYDVIRAHPDTAACLVEIGGELKGFGTRADGMPFWIDLSPNGDDVSPTYRAALYGWACATSGETERFHESGGSVYSHILDPETGASAQSDLIAATVFDKECARADALATALIVMGSNKALAFANERLIPCVLTPRAESADILSNAMREWI
ncbi:MAG: FAD:protein FMN transferase [Pseudomonadota bacterium]